MSQSSFNIGNISRSLFRAAQNAALQALGSKSSGATAPAETYGFMDWADTSAKRIKLRNEANSGWLEQAKTDQPYGYSKLRGPVTAGGTANAITATFGLSAWENDLIFAIEHTAANTGAVTVSIDGLAAKSAFKGNNQALVANDIPSGNFLGLWRYNSTLDKVQLLNPESSLSAGAAVRDLRGFISGLIMSTSGPSINMTVGAGKAIDSTNTIILDLGSAIVKTTSAWAVGSTNGGLDTGVIANTTTYFYFLIRRPDTGVVDVLFSLSATAPTLPANYTQFRRIGAARTNGAGQWIPFIQNDDTFLWVTPIIDVDAVNPGTAAVTRNITIPASSVISFDALLIVGGYTGTNNFTYLISSLDVPDLAPQAYGTATLSGISSGTAATPGASGWDYTPHQVRAVNRQIRSRLSASGASDRLGIITRGWIDTRGANG